MTVATMVVFEFLSFMLVVTVGISLACKSPEVRDSQPLQERARVPDYIIYGTVISDKMPTETNRSIDEQYEVRFEPLCWLKGGPESDTNSTGPETTGGNSGEESLDEMARNSTNQDELGLQNITVAEDLQGDCVPNDLKKGQKYILFLKKDEEGKFSVDDGVNEESGAIDGPNDELFEAVHRGIDAGMHGRPEAECKEGVAIPCFVGDDDRDVCNKGVAQGVAVWALVLSGVIALAGYF